MVRSTFTDDRLGLSVEDRKDWTRPGPGSPVWSPGPEKCQLSPGWGFRKRGEGMGWRQFGAKILGLGDRLGERGRGAQVASSCILAGTVTGVARIERQRGRLRVRREPSPTGNNCMSGRGAQEGGNSDLGGPGSGEPACEEWWRLGHMRPQGEKREGRSRAWGLQGSGSEWGGEARGCPNPHSLPIPGPP